MLNNQGKLVLTAAILAMMQPQACNTQFFPQYNAPYPGSVSRARSTASESQLGLGALGVSRGVVDAQTQSESNGGYENGGTTSIANSRARTHGVNLGGLDIGSTLTSSRKQNNGAVSRGVAHDFNVGGLGIGSSLSRDNLNNGLGLQRSQQGDLQLGLGLLNFDLSRKQQQEQQQEQQSHVQTQAQAQAQGQDAYARSNSQADTQSRQLGLLGFSRTQSQSDALSASRNGQTSATAGGATNSFRGNGIDNTNRYNQYPGYFLRAKRAAQFIPFLYENIEYDRPRRHGFRHSKPNNYGSELIQAIASGENEDFEHQAGGDSESNREINENSVFQNNDDSNVGSQLGGDGSANVNQGSSFAHVGTKGNQNDNVERYEDPGGSQDTNNNKSGSSSRGVTSDPSAQSLSGDNNEQNPAAQGGVRRGGKSANAIAAVSTDSDVKGGTADGKVRSFGDFGGAQAVSGALGNINRAPDFTNGHSGFSAFELHKRKSSSFYAQQQSRQQRQQQQQRRVSAPTLETMKNVTENNWPKNRVHNFNNYPQQDQQSQPKQQQQQQHHHQQQHQQRGQQPQQSHPQQLHYSSINSNSSTEQFAVIDQNERNGRTFSFITDLINNFVRPTCIYPCTLDAYHQQRCCESAAIGPQLSLPPPPLPPSVCCQQPLLPPPPPPPPVPFPPLFIRPPLTVLPPVRPPPLPPLIPTLNFPLIPTQCCNSCPAFGYYGPPPCLRYKIPPAPGRFALHMAGGVVFH